MGIFSLARTYVCALGSCCVLSGCYLSREVPREQELVTDAGPTDAPPPDVGRIRLLPSTCRLSDCYRIFSDERGLFDLDGQSCCFEANCTDPGPVRRAWIVSCHDGTVHATEVFPIND